MMAHDTFVVAAEAAVGAGESRSAPEDEGNGNTSGIVECPDTHGSGGCRSVPQSRETVRCDLWKRGDPVCCDGCGAFEPKRAITNLKRPDGVLRMPAESTCELVCDMLGSTVRHRAGGCLYKVKGSDSHPNGPLLPSQCANYNVADLLMLPR